MWKPRQYTYWHANMYIGFNMHIGTVFFMPICILAPYWHFRPFNQILKIF